MRTRRTYLKAIGTAGLAATAGCIGDGGDGGSPTGTGTGTGTGAEQQAIVAGTAPGFPPFEMKKGGELLGFDTDLLEAVVEEADGYTCPRSRVFPEKQLNGARSNARSCPLRFN